MYAVITNSPAISAKTTEDVHQIPSHAWLSVALDLIFHTTLDQGVKDALKAEIISKRDATGVIELPDHSHVVVVHTHRTE